MQYFHNESFLEQKKQATKREIFLLFNDLMHKFKQNELVSKEEINSIEALADNFVLLFVNNREEVEIKAAKERVQSFLPPLMLLRTLCETQARTMEITDHPSFNDAGNDSPALLAVMTSLFKQNPIKNLMDLLLYYREYIDYVEAQSNSSEAISLLLKEAKEHTDLLHYLDIESRRKEVTADLTEKIKGYESQYDEAQYNKHALNELYAEIQDTRFLPYLTREQAKKINAINDSINKPLRKELVLQKNPSSSASLVFGHDQSLMASPFCSPLEKMYSAYNSPTPDRISNGANKVTAPVSMLRPRRLFPEATPGETVNEQTGRSRNSQKSLTLDKSTDNSQLSVPMETAMGHITNPSSSGSKKEVLPGDPGKIHRSLSTGSFHSVSLDNLASEKLQQNVTKKTTKAPTGSSSLSFWFLAALAGGVTAAVLLLLASSLASPMAAAGWACVGLGAVGFFLTCRSMRRNNTLELDTSSGSEHQLSV